MFNQSFRIIYERASKHALGLLFFFFAFCYQWILFEGVLTINSDDVQTLLKAQNNIGSAKDFAMENNLYAQSQGRFFLIVSGWLAYGQYMLSPIISTFFGAAISTLVVASIMQYLHSVFEFSSKSVYVIGALLFFAVPLYNAWHGFYHYYLFFKAPVFMILFGAVGLYAALSKDFDKKVFSGLLLCSLAMVSLGALVWELYFVISCAVIAVTLTQFVLRNKYNFRQLFSSKILIVGGSFACLCLLYIIAHTGYKAAHPGRTVRHLGLSLDFGKILVTSAKFVYTGIPLNPVHWDVSHWMGTRFGREIFAPLTFVMLSLFFLFRKINGMPKAEMPPKSFVLTFYPLVAWAAVLLAIILLYSITSAYQDWINNYRPWYTPTYLISLLLLMPLGYALAWLLDKNRFFQILSFTCLISICIMSTYVNQPIALYAKQHSEQVRATQSVIDFMSKDQRSEGVKTLVVSNIELVGGGTEEYMKQAFKGDISYLQSNICSNKACPSNSDDVGYIGSVRGSDGGLHPFFGRVTEISSSGSLYADEIIFIVSDQKNVDFALIAKTGSARIVQGRIRLVTFGNSDFNQVTFRFSEPVNLTSIMPTFPVRAPKK